MVDVDVDDGSGFCFVLVVLGGEASCLLFDWGWSVMVPKRLLNTSVTGSVGSSDMGIGLSFKIGLVGVFFILGCCCCCFCCCCGGSGGGLIMGGLGGTMDFVWVLEEEAGLNGVVGGGGGVDGVCGGRMGGVESGDDDCVTMGVWGLSMFFVLR